MTILAVRLILESSQQGIFMKYLILSLALATSIPAVYAQDDLEDLSKVNGSVTAKAGRAYGDVSTVNGSISIESKATAQDVDTVNGEITVDSGAKIGDVSTVNGEIILRNDVSARSVETVNGSITGVSNVRVAKNVEAVNGSIEIGANSVIQGSVENVNGSIKLLALKVQGNIETVNGNITLGDNTEITGSITVRKATGWGMNWGKPKVPRIVIGPNVQVHGPLVFEREVELYVHSSAKLHGKITGATAVSYTDKVPNSK